MSIPHADKKLPAALLAIFIGWTGAHKFYLGYQKEGIIQLITSLFCIGGILGFIEGLIYLTKSDEEFVNTYINGRKGWL
jgi:TM2 domain-containing membrane protein YozV